MTAALERPSNPSGRLVSTSIQMISEPDSFNIFLNVLGALIEVRCAKRSCMEGVRQQFSAAEAFPWRTPDIVLHCDWPTAGRYLFRDRPANEDGKELVGVRVRTIHQAEATIWTSRSKPLPPMERAPFASRFFALHAACLGGVGVEQALLIVGERKAGKTSLALQLVNELGCSLMSDETAILHLRSKVAEPFATPIGIDSGTSVKTIRPATEACTRIRRSPAVVSLMVFLDKSNQQVGTTVSGADTGHLYRIGPLEALRRALKEHLDVKGGADAAMVSLVDLVKTTPAYVANVGRYDQYPKLAKMIIDLPEIRRDTTRS